MAISTGAGAILYRGQTVPPGTPASDTFVAVGRVKNVGGPQIQKEQVDATSLDSTGGFKEYLSGLKEPGQLTFTLFFDPANGQHVGIQADAQASTALSQRNWRLVWPNSQQADFVGEVMGYNRDTQSNEVLTAEITTQITGVITFT